MAGVNERGETIEDAKFPFALSFEPHPHVRSLFPKELPGTDPMIYVSQLESVPANSTLYYVNALDAPTELGGEWKQIGTLELDGNLVKSKFGDEVLLFRHQLMNDDVKKQPSWADYLPAYKFFGSGCPFLN